MPEIILSIGGKRFTAWQSLAISRSMQRGPHEFLVSAPGGSNWANDLRRAIREGDPVSIMLDDELLLTGAIDDRSPVYDATSHKLTLAGRSRLADLVDCSVNSRTFNNQSLLQICQSLCKPFNIDVVDDAMASKPFKSLALNEGQSIWDFLETAARIRAVLLVEDADGRLHITRSGQERSETPLVLGRNILRGSGKFSFRDVYSAYEVLSNQAQSDSLLAETVAHNSARSIDSRVKRYRPLTIINDDPSDTDDCSVKANWHRNVHAGRSQSIVYTVKGWKQINGMSWRSNLLVPVDDIYEGINEDRIITEARFIRDEKGDRSELKVMPKSTFDLIELPEPESNNEVESIVANP